MVTRPPERAVTAAELGIPEAFNLAAYLVDRHLAEGRGSRVAILCGDEAVTYAQVAERSNRLGSALRALGVQREQRVALLLLDSPAFVYSFIGAIKIGAVPVPFNTLLRPPDYAYMLNDSRAAVAVVSAPLLPLLRAIPSDELRYLREVVVTDDGAPMGTRSFDALLAGGSPELEIEPTSRDDVAFWLYSSGTTGFPKGTVHLHHDAVVTSRLFGAGVLGITEDDRTFSVAKLFFAYGLGNALTFPFSVGATTILYPERPGAADIYAQIGRYRPTIFFWVPTGYAMMLAHRREDGRDFDLSSVRLAVSAGEALPKALYERFQERFGVELLDGIGSTEALQTFISNRPGHVRPGSSGLVVPGYEAKVVDEHGREVPRGEVGDLWVRADSTCAYYWNKHERTKETIVGHWLRTGDKFRQDADGYFWYAGRSDDMLKVGGIWVSPAEVESALLEHPAVLEVAVVGRQDRDGLTKPMAFVVLQDGHRPSDALSGELRELARTRIAEYKRPRWLEFVPELPKTATGKIQRHKLRALAEAIAGMAGRTRAV